MFSLLMASAQYSNAVLVAILPQVSDFSTGINLPMNLPVEKQMVRSFQCGPAVENPSGYLVLTNGYEFWYNHGHISEFASPHSYYRSQDPSQVTNYYGTLKLSEKESIQLARNTLIRLGYNLDSIFANQAPTVIPPPHFEGHVVPIYHIIWHNPLEVSSLDTAITIDVDGENKLIQSLSLRSRVFYRPPPVIDLPKEVMPAMSHVKGEAVKQLCFSLLPKISAYAALLKLDIPLPVKVEDVQDVDVKISNLMRVKLRSQYRFWCDRSKVVGFEAPDTVFNTDPSETQLPISVYTGVKRLTVSQAIQVVRDALNAMGYRPSLLGIDETPAVTTPLISGEYVVPRLQLDWSSSSRHVQAEVDIDKGRLKALTLIAGSNCLRGAALKLSDKTKTVSNANLGAISSSGSRPEMALRLNNSAAAHFVAERVMCAAAEFVANKLGLALPSPMLDRDVLPTTVVDYDDTGNVFGRLDVSHFRFYFDNQQQIWKIVDTSLEGALKGSGSIVTDSGISISTNQALSIANGFIMSLSASKRSPDIDFVPEVKLLLGGRLAYQKHRPQYFSVTWRDRNGVLKILALIDGVSRSFVSIQFTDDSYSSIRCPVINDYDKLLAAADDEFLKCSYKERMELVRRCCTNFVVGFR